ncbi:TPA: hypothetical protein ACHOY5_003907 [Raoultella planticola]
MTLQAVNELIQSLESAGELSIREQKFLKLAKAYQQLAAENVALKSKGKELLGEACAVYSRLNKLIDPSLGDFVDGQTLHEFQFVLDSETPATDRIVAGIKADGVEMVLELISHTKGMLYADSVKETLSEVSSRLREGANK